MKKHERSFKHGKSNTRLLRANIFRSSKKNQEKFVDLIKPFIDSRSRQRWITTEELCAEIGTSSSAWLKSDVRNHPVVVAARRVDTRPYKYKADHIEAIQKVWDERKERRR